MEDKPKFDRVNAVLKPYVLINQQMDAVNNDVADFMYALIKDRSLYQAFKKDPKKALLDARVDISKMDIDHLRAVVDIIIKRVDLGDLGQAATQMTKKETSEGQQYNFDHSSSWFMNKEGNFAHERGSSSSQSTNEMTGTTKTFEGASISRRPDEVLRHELGLIFFPGQPLVTPALIEKIKQQINP